MSDSICDKCSFTYYEFIAKFYQDNDKSVDFLRSHGVLPSAVSCPNCETLCDYLKDQSLWSCKKSYCVQDTKKRRFCDYAVSDYKGTLLENTDFDPWKIVLFVNHFLNWPYEQTTLLDCLKLTIESFDNWRSFCFDVIEEWLSNQEPIGGENIEVELDETLISRRNYEGGPIQKQIRLLGGIERESKRRFVTLLPLTDSAESSEDRDKTEVYPLVEKYIKPGSIIYHNNSWTAYDKSNNLRYKLFVVNHSGSLGNNTSDVHAQEINKLWRKIKKWSTRLGPEIKSQYFYQYLATYLFTTSANHTEYLHLFFTQAAKLNSSFSENKQRPFLVVHHELDECEVKEEPQE